MACEYDQLVKVVMRSMFEEIQEAKRCLQAQADTMQRQRESGEDT